MPNVFERMVEESLQRLREHHQVSKAHYILFRNVFKVTNTVLNIIEFSVKGLKRNKLGMEHDQENMQHNQLHKAKSAAMSSLDSEEGPVDREGSDNPVDHGES